MLCVRMKTFAELDTSNGLILFIKLLIYLITEWELMRNQTQAVSSENTIFVALGSGGRSDVETRNNHDQ